MADYDLPPPPHVRIWKGKVFSVSTRYSSAGLSTSIFLDSPDGRLILDCGDGCVRDSIEIERFMRENGHDLQRRNLKEAGESIIGAVISHPHYDHYSGLLTLLNFLQLLGRENPFPIIYPKGAEPVEAMVDHFTDQLWEEPLFDIDLVQLSPGSSMLLAGVKIECISSEHRHSRPGKVGGPVCALSYRFSKDGERVVYTGDTGDVSPIKDLARDSDLVIIEATFAAPGPDSRGVHLTLDQAIDLSSVAKEHMLVHFTAWSYERALKEGMIEPW